jgi:hypothetical protein
MLIPLRDVKNLSKSILSFDGHFIVQSFLYDLWIYNSLPLSYSNLWCSRGGKLIVLVQTYCEICGSHSGEYEDGCFLGCCAM